jgi:hypothetical protein
VNPYTLIAALDARTGKSWTCDGRGEYRTLDRSHSLEIRPDEAWISTPCGRFGKVDLHRDPWDLADAVAAVVDGWNNPGANVPSNDNATLPGVNT